MRKTRIGLTDGTEIPLANFLVFEVWGGGKKFESSLNAAVAKAQYEQEEADDIAATSGTILGLESGVGGRSARPASLLKEMSTDRIGIGAPTAVASAGLLG